MFSSHVQPVSSVWSTERCVLCALCRGILWFDVDVIGHSLKLCHRIVLVRCHHIINQPWLISRILSCVANLLWFYVRTFTTVDKLRYVKYATDIVHCYNNNLFIYSGYVFHLALHCFVMLYYVYSDSCIVSIYRPVCYICCVVKI